MDYNRTLATAKRLLTGFGQSVTITNHDDGGYDIATATVAVTDAPIVTTGVVLPLSTGVRGFRYGTAEQSGSNILSSDQQLLLPGGITEPKVGATVTIGAKTFRLIAVSPINPAGMVVIYDCVIRGAE